MIIFNEIILSNLKLLIEQKIKELRTPWLNFGDLKNKNISKFDF